MRADRPDSPHPSRHPIGLVAEEITREIIGAFFEVRKDLKPGYLESVYRNSLEIAIRDRGLRVEREVGLDVRFRGQVVGTFRADLLVQDTVIVEAKMADRLHPARAKLQQALASEVKSALSGSFPFAGADCAALTERVLALLD